MNPVQLAVPGVQGLAPYLPGKPESALQRELGINDIVKLASNENPLGAAPEVRALLAAGLNGSNAIDLGRYPDGSGHELKSALAGFLQVNADQITLGNGSNDVLDIIGRCYLNSERSAVFSQYAFAVYYLVTQATGAEVVMVPATQQDDQRSGPCGHDLPAMAAAVREDTQVVFLANPNNPTGTWFTQDELFSFLQLIPTNVLVVVDEAYVEYQTEGEYPDTLGLLALFPNLIITRTFSKAYGLAALRVGYAISSPEIANVLNRVRQPFNVNTLALAAAETALACQDHVDRARVLNSQGMEQLQSGLANLGLACLPSIANFVCVDCNQPGVIIAQLLERLGVIVRPVANYGLENYLRISIGLPEENERFLKALASVLKQAPEVGERALPE